MEIARDAAAILVTFALAGWLLGVVVVPERLVAFQRLFLSLALAIPATVLLAVPGLLAGRLSALTFLAWGGLLAIVAARRSGNPLRRLGEPAGRAVRRVRASSWRSRALVVVALAAGWLAVLSPQGAADLHEAQPNGTIVYYHWGVVQRIAEAGEIPPTLPEWGAPRPFPYEYLASAIHGAATSALGSTSDYAMSERYRVALALLALLAALALWRRWLPLWWAWIAAILTLSVSRVETRLLVYKPEAVALVLALWSGWLLDVALERRSGRWGALAGIVLATAFLAHPIGSLLAAPLWAGIIVGRIGPRVLAAARRRGAARRRRGAAPAQRRLATRRGMDARRLTQAVVIALATFALIFVSVRTLVGTTEQDLSQRAQGANDPTKEIYALAYVSADPTAARGLNLPECSDLFGVHTTTRPFLAANASWLSFDLSRPGPLILLGGALILAAGVALIPGSRRARSGARLRRGAVTWVVYAVGVYLLALLICAVYHTWVPERVGPLRVLPYWSIAIGGGLAAAAAFLTERLGGSGRRQAVVGLALSAGLLSAFTPALSGRDSPRPAFESSGTVAGGLAPAAEAAYRWMDRNLPPDATVLANGYTEGALGMLSGRTGWLDGRTPFVQPDPWRSQARRSLKQARRYFLDPDLDRLAEPVDYIVVSRPGINLGGPRFETNREALVAAEHLAPLQSFGDVEIYAVRRHDDVAAQQ